MATTDKCQGIFPPEGSVNHFNHTLLEVILELSVPYNSHNFSELQCLIILLYILANQANRQRS